MERREAEKKRRARRQRLPYIEGGNGHPRVYACKTAHSKHIKRVGIPHNPPSKPAFKYIALVELDKDGQEGEQASSTQLGASSHHKNIRGSIEETEPSSVAPQHTSEKENEKIKQGPKKGTKATRRAQVSKELSCQEAREEHDTGMRLKGIESHMTISRARDQIHFACQALSVASISRRCSPFLKSSTEGRTSTSTGLSSVHDKTHFKKCDSEHNNRASPRGCLRLGKLGSVTRLCDLAQVVIPSLHINHKDYIGKSTRGSLLRNKIGLSTRTNACKLAQALCVPLNTRTYSTTSPNTHTSTSMGLSISKPNGMLTIKGNKVDNGEDNTDGHGGIKAHEAAKGDEAKDRGTEAKKGAGTKKRAETKKKAETKMKPETKGSEIKNEIEAKGDETKMDTNVQPDNEMGTKSQINTQFGTEVTSKTLPQTKANAKSQTKTQPMRNIESEYQTKIWPQTKAETKNRCKIMATAKSQTKTQPTRKIETKAQPQNETKAKFLNNIQIQNNDNIENPPIDKENIRSQVETQSTEEMDTRMNTQPKAKIDFLIEAHPEEWAKNVSQNKMRMRVHAEAEKRSLKNIGTASHLTMPFEAKIERVTMESK
jgi:hypothetical protein